MINVEQVLAEHYPGLQKNLFYPWLIHPLLRFLLHEQSFQDFAEEYPHLQGIEFVEQALEYFDFSYIVSDRQRENIPAHGKVMIIANHPIGSLDGLALLKLVHDIRSDVKVVANDLLMSIAPLRNCLLPVHNMTGGSNKTHIQNINSRLDQGGAIIMFPSGEVSRMGAKGIKDGKWLSGFFKIANRSKASILPIHISGRNSVPFYLASLCARPLSTLMLVGEMFKQRRKQIKITVGGVISYETYSTTTILTKEKIKLFRRHLYRIGAGKSPLFETESAIARPERKADLKKAVQDAEKVGMTPDGKAIYLFSHKVSSPIMREIGRLRESAFRAVGEGSGYRRDIDKYDSYYQHLILWDEEDLEIAGAYRFIDAEKTVSNCGIKGLYSGSLFNLDHRKDYFIENGLELGRSFVQQRYWGKRSLDYLWYGIGCFLRKNDNYKYLFGAVSISNAMPHLAKELLIFFYKLYFSRQQPRPYSINPFIFSTDIEILRAEFTGNDYRSDFKKLKTLLTNLGTGIPPLYKQYTELCEPGGVHFLDFNIDHGFNDCVDGLVIVEVNKIKERKRKRYIEKSLLHHKGQVH